ncbi:MAG: von Willebrand factor type A domain-containing protein [Brumimicrobium sp.]
MEKLILVLVITLSSFVSIAQSTGSLLLKCKEKDSLHPIEGLCVEVFQDTLCWEGVTQSDGSIRFNELSPGSAKINFIFKNHFEEQEVFIQEKQLFQYTVLLDSAKLKLKHLSAEEYEESINGREGEQTSIDEYDLPIQTLSGVNVSTQEIDEIQIVAYKAPLINKDGGAQAQTITREDIMRMPVRSAQGVASTIGGVNSNASNDALNVRGMREDANYYYIDGVKVVGSSNLPKSYIGSIKVYNHSIPAYYGDVTGGVISIESKPISMGRVPMRTNQPKTQRANTYNYEEPERFNYDNFLPIYENDFLSPLMHPHATFGLDVDQAAWEYLKYSAAAGRTIQRDAIKLEEMINAFEHKDVSVPENELFNVNITRSNCSWNKDNELVSVHLKARDLPKTNKRKPHNFVFLIDVSGSMNSSNRLPLIVKGLRDFVKSLQPEDRIAIVTYSGYTGVVLPSTACEDKNKIMSALSGLQSGGSTNGIGGIKEAYRQAESSFDIKYNNRIILATDGDFNVGINSPGDLENYISKKRGQGIYLTALGVGMGNYKNSTLETLAKRGDGNHFYIRSLNDMDRVLSNVGNLINIARDVKLNVEFNPRLVSNYRLIGYENRLMKPKDFADDTKDGGELGYGHYVTAVFEVEKGKSNTVESEFVKQRSKLGKSDLAYVKLRYKPLDDSVSVQREYTLLENRPIEDNELLNLIIALGLELRDSAFKGDLSKAALLDLARSYSATTEQEVELKNLTFTLFSEG